MKITLTICLLWIAFGDHLCLAHEGPAEIIQRLSHRIDSGKGTAEDYRLRAVEWRILGKSDRAARDLQLALRSDPGSQSAWRELARVLLLLNDPNGAVEAARRALEIVVRSNPEAGGSTSSARILFAEILFETGHAQIARREIDTAFSLRPQQGVDAWWLRAEILAELDDHAARIECLHEGWKETASEALRIAWIDAAIESGRGEVVISQVEESLQRCRLKASWRIRRARVAVSFGEKSKAETDLLLAMEELEGRFNPSRPDRMLEKDLESARHLLRSVLQ